MNNLKPEGNANVNTTIETVTTPNRNEWNDTGERKPLTPKMIYIRNYYRKNKNKIKKQVKEYSEKHSEEGKKWRKEMYEKKKEEILADRKKYYEKNKEKIKRRVTKRYYRQKNNCLKKYIRKCPICKYEKPYPCKESYTKAIRKNNYCFRCAYKKQLKSKNLKPIGKRLTRNCLECGKMVTHSSPELRRIGELKNKSCRLCAKEKVKQKFLEKKLCTGQIIFANFSLKACEYFDKLNKEKGWNLQHAMNGGEIRVMNYFLDAYDKEKNIVVEYDESRHYDKKGNLQSRDVLRQNRITKKLCCKFYRYNETTNQLLEHICN